MSEKNIVEAAHLECVDNDHNKYYRTYLVQPRDGIKVPSYLVRNWGRRGAPKGQWMRDPHLGSSASIARHNLEEEKIYVKNYVEIFKTEFEIDDAEMLGLYNNHRKILDENHTKVLSDVFEFSWCQEVEDLASVHVDDAVLGFAWILDWSQTITARAPARAFATDSLVTLVHKIPQSDTAVVQAPMGVLRRAEVVFDSVDMVPCEPEDDPTLAVVASRLWAPNSSGPYKSLTRAVKDARRLFRRPAALKQ